jgi:hypothetical protein
MRDATLPFTDFISHDTAEGSPLPSEPEAAMRKIRLDVDALEVLSFSPMNVPP